MKKSKRIIGITILICVFILTLCACKNKKDSISETADNQQKIESGVESDKGEFKEQDDAISSETEIPSEEFDDMFDENNMEKEPVSNGSTNTGNTLQNINNDKDIDESENSNSSDMDETDSKDFTNEEDTETKYGPLY